MAIVKRRKASGSNCNIPRILLLGTFLFTWFIFIPGFPQEENPALLQPNDIRPENVLENPDLYLYRRVCREERPAISSIAKCYPNAPLQPLMNSSCTDVKTWSDVQTCLVGRRNAAAAPTTPRGIQIHVIGERNSGTKWLQQELAKCFPREKLGVRCHRDFVRSKHFFQPPSRGNFDHSIVIAIFRDPVQWIAAMREKPYHMPYQMDGFDMNQKRMPAIPLEWEKFIQRSSPWTMPERSKHDLQILRDGKQNQVTCRQGFTFNEIVPCQFDNATIPESKWRGHEPFYEMRRDNSGKPFEDLLKLRSEKILNFVLEVPLLMRLAGFSAVRYEDLLLRGTRFLMEQIADMMGLQDLPESCKPLPPQPERLEHRQIPAGFRSWVEDRLVMDTEHLLGYR